MAEVVRMPRMSDTMTEGVIVEWHKKVGDKVKPGDLLAEVETDKATMELVGYEEGTLLYIGVEAGEAAKINQIIAIVGKAGTDVSAYVAAEKTGGNQLPVDRGSLTESEPAPTKEQPSTANSPSPADEQQATNNGQRLKASPLADRKSVV